MSCNKHLDVLQWDSDKGMKKNVTFSVAFLCPRKINLKQNEKREKIKEDKHHKIYFPRNINLDHFYALSELIYRWKKSRNFHRVHKGLKRIKEEKS